MNYPARLLMTMILIWTGGYWILPPVSQAYFIPSAYGVRPAGMGEAFVSLADDANAVLYNPAGLAQLRVVDITTMYSELYANLNARMYTYDTTRFGHNFIALTIPIEEIHGSIGLSWLRFATALYSENTTSVSYGFNVLSPNQTPLGIGLSLGANLKMLQWLLEKNTYSEAYPSHQQIGYTVDAGLLANYASVIIVGVSVENILPVDMGITVPEIIPLVYRSGITFFWPSTLSQLDSLQTTFEADIRDDQTNSPCDFKMGAESWWFKKTFAIRAGLTPYNADAGFSYQYSFFPTFQLQFDYAFSYPFNIQNNWGSHRVGISAHWNIHPDSPKPISNAILENQILMQKNLEIKITEARDALQSIKMSVKAAADACNAAETSAENTKKIFDEIIQDSDYETSSQVLIIATNAKDVFLSSQDASAKAQQAEQEATKALQSIAEIQKKEGGINNEPDAVLNYCQIATYSASSAQQAATIAVEKSKITANYVEEAQRFKYSIREKFPDKIVIGVEESIFKDFGDSQKIAAAEIILYNYLKQKVNFPFVIKSYRFDELKYAFLHGEVDILISYSNYFNAFYKHGVLHPVLTIQKNHKDSQPYCLIVLENSPIQNTKQLLHKRLGYPSSEILTDLKPLFNKKFPGLTTDQIFTSKEKFSDRVNALLALQIDVVDTFIEAEYIFDIYNNRITTMPKKIKILEATPLIPHRPIYLKRSTNEIKNERMQQLITAMKSFHEDSASPAFLSLFHIDKFITFDENKYRNYFSAE